MEELKRSGVDGLGAVLTPSPVVEAPNDFRFLPSYLEEGPRTSFDLDHIPRIPLLTGVTKHETAGAVSGKLRNSLIEKLKTIPNFINDGNFFHSATLLLLLKEFLCSWNFYSEL